MTRPFPVLALVLAATPALAQPAGSTNTGTGPGNTAGAQTSLPGAIRNQTPDGSPSAR